MTGASHTDEYDFIVLGAGVAGLAAAYKLSKAGKSVLILEKDDRIGGLAKTLQIDGFLFDYCAHRFHTPDPALKIEMAQLMGENWVEHRQKSRILMFGKYLKYPFQLQNLLRGMPKGQALLCGIDFFTNMLRNKLRPMPTGNYRDWFVRFFGKRLYRVMCEPYTRKIWGMDPSLISSDWADQRFQGPNLKKLIKSTLKKLLHLDFSSYDLDDELAPDGGLFHYPKRGGFQAVPDRMAEETQKHGGVIVTKAAISSIDASARRVRFSQDRHERSASARAAIISTIPLQAYLKLLEQPVPEEVSLAAKDLRYMNIVFVFLFIDRPHVSNDTWLYFPDRGIAFNRAVEFKNWADDMAPADKTSLCLDITVTPENGEITDLPDDALIAKCAQDCEDANLCKKSEITKGNVVRVPYAYPVYDLDYRRKLTRIVTFIESFPGICCLGRTGIFRYQNTDGAIDTAFMLSRRLLDASETEKSIFAYSMKGVSY